MRLIRTLVTPILAFPHQVGRNSGKYSDQYHFKLKEVSLIICFLPLLGLLFTIPSVQACTTPVFQYALERWAADPYEAFIFHRGPLSTEDQTRVDQLKKAPRDERFSANILVKTVDLAESPSESMQKLWEAQQNPELPWMVVKYPRYSRILGDAWAGKLRDIDLKAFLDSPARKKIASRILKGETAVWAFLESGDEQKDKTTFDLLEKELKRMSEIMKVEIPVIYMEEPGETSQDVKFSAMKLSRRDPRERFFIQMLLNTEPDLKTIPKPMAFPIFARGRLLYAFVGEGISPDNIEAVCAFLVAWCSCEIKELNPGVDLLMSVNWDNAIYSGMHEEILLAMSDSESPAKVDENLNESKLQDQDKEKPEVEKTPKPEIEAIPDKPEPEIVDEKENTAIIPPKPAIKVSENSADLKLNELNKGAESVAAVSESVAKTSDSVRSSNLARNILLMMSSLILGVAIIAFVMLWRRRQRA